VLQNREESLLIFNPVMIVTTAIRFIWAASLTKIGRSFGGKHHTTGMYSIQKVDEQHLSDKSLNIFLEKLQNILRLEWPKPDG
jgi:chromosomal replication initiator protein